MDLRVQQELTQEELAAKAGTSPTTISNLESGRVARPQYRTLRKVAAALGVDVEELVSPKAQAPLPLEYEGPTDQKHVPGIEVGKTFFVPLEDGEEPDVVTLRLHYVRLMEEHDRVLQEVTKLREQLAEAGRRSA
jgi:transcriptional regulator with XRE-family HTH domain